MVIVASSSVSSVSIAMFDCVFTKRLYKSKAIEGRLMGGKGGRELLGKDVVVEQHHPGVQGRGLGPVVCGKRQKPPALWTRSLSSHRD